MSSRLLAGPLLGILILLSACGSGPPAEPATSTPVVSTADAAFVRTMIAYHRHNLAVLALADTRAANSEVKQLAVRTAGLQRLQQTTMTTLLMGWSQPTSVPDTSDSHVTRLRDLSGDLFDRGLLQTMISHNEDAVRAARQAMAGRLGQQTRSIAASVDSGLSAENVSLRQILDRLRQATGAAP